MILGLVNLSLAIITINGWNRLATGFRKIPGEYQPHKDRLSRLSQHISERTGAVYNMKKLILSVFIFTLGFATATQAQQVNTLLTKPLPEAPGKEIEVITVNYAPGAVDTIHRHDAHAVVYVLEAVPRKTQHVDLYPVGTEVVLERFN